MMPADFVMDGARMVDIDWWLIFWATATVFCALGWWRACERRG